MSSYINEINSTIAEIKTIVKQEQLKPLILKLAKSVAQGLTDRRPEVLNQLTLVKRAGNDTSDLKNVSKIVKYLKDKHFNSVSDRWIEKCLPEEYKETRTLLPKEFDINSISDTDLVDKGSEIIKRYKKLMSHGPAQEIKFKELKSIEEDDDEFPLKKVWLELYKNFREDWETKRVSTEEMRMIRDRFKTISDKRFATGIDKYEAILVACSTYDSLNNSTKYETEILSRWQLFDREQACKKCKNNILSCRGEKCSCACHEAVKRLTTKGLKWAREHNPHLEKLDAHIKKLSEWHDDICAFSKVILKSAHLDDYMKKEHQRNILSEHIIKDKCEQCEFFLEDHPDFFKEK